MHRVVDSGLPPSAPPHAAAFPWPAQRELAVVLYTPNVLRGSPHALTVLVRDVWAKKDLGTASGTYVAKGLAGHDAAFLTLSASA